MKRNRRIRVCGKNWVVNVGGDACMKKPGYIQLAIIYMIVNTVFGIPALALFVWTMFTGRYAILIGYAALHLGANLWMLRGLSRLNRMALLIVSYFIVFISLLVFTRPIFGFL